MTVTAPAASTVTAGDSMSITVTAYDAYGNVATGYSGTVKFSNDDKASLPRNYTFTAADAGVLKFQVTFERLGYQSLKVTDTQHSSINCTPAQMLVKNKGDGDGDGGD